MARKAIGRFYFSGERARRCPRRDCANHRSTDGRDFLKKGYYKTRWNGQQVRRWKCRRCGVSFSSHTNSSYYRQHRPDLNDPVFRLYASGMTQRRMAICLEVNRKTIVRKFRYLALLAAKHHRKHIRGKQLRTHHAQLDEMESFIHTRLKPVTISLAVRAKTGEIVDMRVAQATYKGKLAQIALRKYGPRPHRAKDALNRSLSRLTDCAEDSFTVTTDRNPLYPSLIEKHLPTARHVATSRIPKEKTDRANKNDALFTLNYTCAKIRNDLSRMMRKTWVTTKKLPRLQAHLNLYTVWLNRYQVAM